jgi:hypothetical protein
VPRSPKITGAVFIARSSKTSESSEQVRTGGNQSQLFELSAWEKFTGCTNRVGKLARQRWNYPTFFRTVPRLPVESN